MANVQIPTEIWSAIIERLPTSQQKTCLSVSRLHHDLAARFLFSVIKIYFTRELSGMPEEEELRLMSHSWEILDHITRKRQFALAVKKIVVLALCSETEMIFERRCLIKALEFVPHLDAFHWVGSHPPCPGDVAEALARSCPNLQELRLLPHLDFCAQSLVGLHHLRRLQFSWSFLHDLHGSDVMDHASEVEMDTGHFRLGDLLAIVNANSVTLTELDLLGSHVGDVPIRIFTALTHLEICVPEGEELRGLDLVFHHAAGLESLLLVGEMARDVFWTLQKNSSSLPRLSSFQLISYNEFDGLEDCTMVCDFICQRFLLRRFSLHLSAPWSTVMMVLPIVMELPNLRALGLHIEYDDELDFAFLASHLPMTLEALQLSIPWDNYLMLTPLLQGLAKLPMLSFLHLFGIGDYLPLTAEDLADDLVHLQIVGRQHRLWDILRLESGPSLSQWWFRRTKWSAKEDFAGGDGDWLLKYR